MTREAKESDEARGDEGEARRTTPRPGAARGTQRPAVTGGAPRRGPAELRPPGMQEEEPEGVAWKGALAVALVVGGLVAWRACTKEDPRATAPAAGSAAAQASAAVPAATATPRCAAVGAPFQIGEAPKPKRVDADAGAQGAEDEQLAPFAVEVGRGAVLSGGFAVGALRQAEGGTVAMVATLGADGAGGKLVRLARSRGDLDPPVVAGLGGALLVAMLEPNAGGRAIKLARVEGEHVTWGAELSEGRDESLAIDAAASGERAILVWDDVTRDGKRSRIMMASVDTATMRSTTSPRPISQPKVDAEVPRVAARPGGYWLAYVARSEERAKKDAEDEDTASAGETIGHQWVEVVPLDETGSPAASARAVTPKDGHVLAFDLAAADDGGAIMAYRDDDTPSGSSGGRVSTVLVTLGGVGQPRVIADEDTVGSGVPSLLPGWIAVANTAGPARLAAMSGKGEIADGLAEEPAVGSAEPIAADRGLVLLARPAGPAMKLEVLRCAAGGPRPPGGDPAPRAPDGAEDRPAPVEERPAPPESADPPP
ncbi:MAG: hypothetical protein IT372_04685 [Polyangiaceae bacterium]|nr:hypothetical protein [Polyangiaceae bacterium]